MNSGRLFLGILAGIATGAILGVLFAPRRGSVTRARITKKGEDYANDVKEAFNGMLNGISENVDNAREVVNDLIDVGKSRFDGKENPEEGKQKHAHHAIKSKV